FKYPEIESFIKFRQPEILRGNNNVNSSGCYMGDREGKYPNPVVEKQRIIIDSVPFCITWTNDSAMGRSYPVYFYTASYKDGNHFTLVFSFEVMACLKENSDYNACQGFLKLNNTDKIINDIMYTFKKYTNNL
ncbi:MAG: hypothetical protein AAB877_03135, partial [Patescibacteria group bacterium]